MDFSFSDNQMMIRDSVRRYAEAELLPNYQRWDRTGEFLTPDYIDKLVNMGLLRLRRPEKYGGQDYSFVDCVIVCEEIGHCDHQIRYIISNAIHLGIIARDLLGKEFAPF
jgi:cyclohexanecarboxyl-CoA dehydrogenase